jgi:surface antigen
MITTARFFAPGLAIALALTLTACGATSQRFPTTTATGPVLTPGLINPPIIAPGAPPQSAAAGSGTDIAAYVSPNAYRLMSARERQEAGSAQFNALQYGRPGAPRTWQGDVGSSGSVTVGPFVRVNNLDCRDFTHTVNIETQAYSQRGMACREIDGRWTVTSSAAV